MSSSEKERVVQHSKIANYAEGVMGKATQYCGEIFKKVMHPGSVLELGPAEGIMTDLLYPFFSDYTVVDGADFFVDAIKERYPNIQGCAALFEEYVPSKTYDNIVLGHVLEHVEDPVEILKKCASWLSSGGGYHSCCPQR